MRTLYVCGSSHDSLSVRFESRRERAKQVVIYILYTLCLLYVSMWKWTMRETQKKKKKIFRQRNKTKKMAASLKEIEGHTFFFCCVCFVKFILFYFFLIYFASGWIWCLKRKSDTLNIIVNLKFARRFIYIVSNAPPSMCQCTHAFKLRWWSEKWKEI